MRKTVAIGEQDYETIRKNDYFYIDKTGFMERALMTGITRVSKESI